ncbi:hypothetical protein [Parasitella parasitica]|uniref:Alpha/beta hydrolase fold-3 domain-containing protein n=1 Tax=Parasitella parasitica TaxID=35722 RepID=A0A0B7NE84_9FUNG|nr:hypothetical protein [Parasitella parasitica]
MFLYRSRSDWRHYEENRGYWIAEDLKRNAKREAINDRISEANVIILWIPGGGFRFDLGKLYTPTFATWIRALEADKRIKSMIFVAEYEHGPEHLFPAAVNQIAKTYSWLTNTLNIDPKKIIIGADDAGAAIALDTLFIKISTQQRPAGMVCASPYTGMEAGGESWRANLDQDIINENSISRMECAYMGPEENDSDKESDGGKSEMEPFSYLRHNVELGSFLPARMLFFLGGKEVLLDEGGLLASRARNSGIQVAVVQEPSGVHLWSMLPDIFIKDQSAKQFMLDRFVEFVASTIEINKYPNGRMRPSQHSESDSTQAKGRRYVEVDSPFAKANRYTYAMPNDIYIASNKVTKILEIGTVDDAADYIRALPIYLQSPVVWNQLIAFCAKHGRANYAEHFFSQMRKRGIDPNEHTFSHMLVAYGKSTSPRSIYSAEAWLKKMKDFDFKPASIHINNLMRVYNHAGHPEKTLALLKQISTSNDILPDAVTYSIALQACPQLPRYVNAQKVRHIWNNILARIEEKQPKQTTSLLSQKAADIIWKEDAIRHDKTKDAELKVDDSLVVALLRAVTQTASAERDVLIGIEAIEKFYSLCPPQAVELLKRNGISKQDLQPGFGFRPSVKVLDAILRFSGALREFKLGKEYFDLAIQQFPQLKPDKYVDDAYAWIETQLQREQNFRKKRYASKS